MDHGQQDRPQVDHSQMDHSEMDHSEMGNPALPREPIPPLTVRSLGGVPVAEGLQHGTSLNRSGSWIVGRGEHGFRQEIAWEGSVGSAATSTASGCDKGARWKAAVRAD
jgi:copper resistance protein B